MSSVLSKSPAPPSPPTPWRGGWAGIYVGLVSVVGFAVLGVTLHEPHLGRLADVGPAFWCVAVLLIASELWPLFTPVSRDADGLPLSTTFVFAVLLYWGLPTALVLQALATLVGDRARGKELWRTVFNIGQYMLSWSAAWLILRADAHTGSLALPMPMDGEDVAFAIAAGIVYFLVNDALVAAGLALYRRRGFRDELFDEFGYLVITTGALLSLSPLVVLAAQRSVAFIPLIVVPLIAVYLIAWVSLERQHRALHDALTGLPNRVMLTQETRDALTQASRSGRAVAFFLLDLDRFKEINDTLGHIVGDRLLRQVATRLAGAVRVGDLLARLGGDEFAVVLPDIDDERAAAARARGLVRALSEPFTVDGMRLTLDGSLGLALYPAHADSVDALMARADVAMYLAKESRSQVEIYSPDRDRYTTARLSLLADLRRVLDGDVGGGALEVHYQPQAELATGAVTGVEALVRWRHPARGVLLPEEFVHLAEHSGMMRALTSQVVAQALADLSDWRQQGLPLRLAVNVSGQDLHVSGGVSWLVGELQRYAVPASAVTLEITEGVLMADAVRAASALQALDDLGVRLSLDDFGTGYSSLAHLRRLPVQEVKIDQSFVRHMDRDADDAAIVRSIIELAKALGLRVVAEGVETIDAWRALADLGCNAAQGWLLGRPLPGPEVAPWLAARGPRLAGVRAATPPAVRPIEQRPAG